MNPRALLVTAAVVSLFLVGCNTGTQNPPTVAASGKVVYQGEAVEGATVQFIPSSPDGKVANATSDAEGTFKLSTFEPGDGAMSGTYKVTVRKLVTVEQGIQKDGENAGQPDFVNKDMLPKKYASAGKTPLELDVSADGENMFEIELTK